MEKLPLLTRKKSYNRLVSTSLPSVWKDKNRPRKKYTSFRTNVRSIFDTSWDRFLHYIRNLCLLSRCTKNFIKFERFDFYILDRGTIQFYLARATQQSNMAARVVRNGVVNFKHFRFFFVWEWPLEKASSYDEAAIYLGTLDTTFMMCYSIGLFISGYIGENYSLRHVLALGNPINLDLCKIVNVYQCKF